MYVDDTTGSDESCCLCFITDDRSAKFLHLGGGVIQGAPIECCWWLDEAAVQFRIAGHALIATARSQHATLRAAAAEVWERLGEHTKRQMFWPHPGVARCEGSASAPGDAAVGSSASLEASHVALVIVVPDHVDELHLSGRQKRIVYSRVHAGGAVGVSSLASEPLTAFETSSCSAVDDVAVLVGLKTAVWTQVEVNP